MSMSLGCVAQGFILEEVDTAWFAGITDGEDGLYAYLNDHATPVSGRKVIAFENPDVREHACHFSRSYQGGLYYEYDACEIEGGAEERLHLPADTDEEKLKEWIEVFAKYSNTTEGQELSWKEGTYAPHGDAGCYYSIGTDQYGRKVLEIYCGC